MFAAACRRAMGPPWQLVTLLANVPSFLILSSVNGLDNGLGRTPAMGFNTWNHFGCDISEALVKQTAHILVDDGFRDAGYIFLNLDDCWEARSRADDRSLVEDKRKFPSGLKSLADFVHDLGLEFGIYSSAGVVTCEGFPASLGYEREDAQFWADIGVSYLKYDNCGNLALPPETRYPVMRDALNATGRPILYSICEWGIHNPAAWADRVGNSWRTTEDIKNSWDSVMSITEINGRLWPYAKPGAFNDPDMLEVGNGNLTLEEARSHMSLWALMKAPLLIGCDLRNIDEESKAILINKDVIAINQDTLGVQGRRIWSDRIDNTAYRPVLRPCGVPHSPISSWSHNMTSHHLHLYAPVRDANPSCLKMVGGRGNATAALLVVGSCEPSGDTSQEWVIMDRTIRPRVAQQLCLAAVREGARRGTLAGVDVELMPCGERALPEHQWRVKEARQGTWLINAWQDSCLAIDLDAPPGSKEEIWAGPLADGSQALLFLNRANASRNIKGTWEQLGLDAARLYEVKDLWRGIEAPEFLHEDGIGVGSVPAHGSVMLRVKLRPLALMGRQILGLRSGAARTRHL